MNFKKLSTVALAAALSLGIVACGGKDKKAEDGGKTPTSTTTSTGEAEVKENEKDAKKIAVLLYKGDDNYIATVRQELEKLDAADPSIELTFNDGQENQGTQTDQINNVVAQGVDGILLNIVDVKAASAAMSTIEAAGIPTVFFNRDMTKDLSKDKLDKFLFVGTNAEEAGIMQGEMLADLWNKDPKAMDRNGNGKLDYVMLNGGVDNPEAQARTKYSVDTLKEKGVEVNELALQDCAWDTDKAKSTMDSWLQTYQDDIDAVISNNDGMAIGALSSLQGVGFNKKGGDKTIPVVGVDAVEQAVGFIKDGTMYGTIKQDAEGMAKASLSTLKNKIDGKDWIEGTDYELAEDGVSIRIPYQKFEAK